MFTVPRLNHQPPQHVREPHRWSVRSAPFDNVHIDSIGLEVIKRPTLGHDLSTNQ